MDRAIEIGKPLIEEREHRLIVRPPAEDIYLEADSTRLAQLIANLLSNAAKFTPKGGTITVACAATDSDALIKVTDSGIGIAAEELPHIFDLFYQADASFGGRYGGMGIGLALARRLVELHGGGIEARSDGPGRGIEFIVWLPRLQQPPAWPAAEPAQPEHAIPSRRILIVDDSIDAAKATQMFLTLRGHEARSVFDGFAAVRLAQEFKPHLVLLDIGMPGMDGFEVARQLRGEVGPVRPLIVALSGHAMRTGPEQMKKAGLDDYLIKPVGPEALLSLISSLT